MLVVDFNRQVFKPFLWEIHEMNKNFLPPTVYRGILGEKLAPEFRATMKDFMMAGIQSFDVLAGAHLAIKQQMVQAMPLIMQYYSSPQLAEQVAEINGEYIDFSELLHTMTDLSGLGSGAFNSIIKKMTPDMLQRRQAKSPQAIQQLRNQGLVQKEQAKGQAASQLQNQKDAAKEQQIEQEWTGRATGDIIRHAIVATGQPEEVTGEPGGAGFGGSELAG